MLVVIHKIEYINDIPIEYTQQAIDAGEIKKGKKVGLLVSPVDDPDKQVRIEIPIQKDGQERLIRKGRVILIEDKHERLRLHDNWRDFVRYE
jgi:hypothetical protein